MSYDDESDPMHIIVLGFVMTNYITSSGYVIKKWQDETGNAHKARSENIVKRRSIVP